MTYFKIINKSNIIVSCEAQADPVYVKKNRNGLRVRCTKAEAQAILCFNGDELAQFSGKPAIGGTAYTATEITQMEYDEWISQGNVNTVNDLEDTAPEVPEGTEEEVILTRAELTARVEMLEECLLEMSEIVYA